MGLCISYSNVPVSHIRKSSIMNHSFTHIVPIHTNDGAIEHQAGAERSASRTIEEGEYRISESVGRKGMVSLGVGLG